MESLRAGASPTTTDDADTASVGAPATKEDKPTGSTPKVATAKLEPPKPKAPASTGGSISGRIKRAEKLIKREKSGEALTLLRSLSSKVPSDGKVAFLRGKAAFEEGKNSEAIKFLSRADKLGYRKAGLYMELGAAYQVVGKSKKAKEAYEKYLQLKPTGPVSEQVRKIITTQL